jgi:hypothetical protein
MSTISVGTTNVNSFIVNTDTTGNLILEAAGTALFTSNVSVKNSSGTYVDVSRGLSKAWVRFFYVNPTLTIYGSFNVSSVTRNGTGDYTINFTTAMPSVNYATIGSAGDNSLIDGASSVATYVRPLINSTTYTRVSTGYANGGLFDYTTNIAVFSS